MHPLQPKHPAPVPQPGASGGRARTIGRRLAGIVWALPLTLVGLLLALPVLASGGSIAITPLLRVGGMRRRVTHIRALLVHGAVADFLLAHHPFGAMHAMAIGHIVIADRNATSRRLLVHELTHVAQAARWGIVFPLAYLTASAWALASGGDVYWDNVFEVAARTAEQHA